MALHTGSTTQVAFNYVIFCSKIAQYLCKNIQFYNNRVQNLQQIGINFSHPFLTHYNLNLIDPDLPYTLTKIIAPCCLFPAPPPNISISPTGKMVCKVSALDHNICSRLDVSDTNFLRKWEIFHNLSRYQKNFKAPSTIDYCKKEEILIISYYPCFLRNNRINATKK